MFWKENEVFSRCHRRRAGSPTYHDVADRKFPSGQIQLNQSMDETLDETDSTQPAVTGMVEWEWNAAEHVRPQARPPAQE